MAGRVRWKAAVLFLSLLSVQAASLQRRSEAPFDYMEQIKCIGDVPSDWRSLWLAKGLDDTEVTEVEYDHPRSVCAPARYGGNPLWNVGMSCPTDTRSGKLLNIRAIERDRLDDDRVSRGLYGEIVEFCGLRCRCIFAPPSSAKDQAYGFQEILDSEALIPAPYDLNRHNDIFRSGTRESKLRALTLPLTDTYGHVIMRGNTRFPRFEAISPDEGKYKAPICLGSPPEWQLPSPFDDSPGPFRFLYLGALCKASWFDGANIGNAGFVCQLNPTTELYELKAREFLSHPSLSRHNKHQPMRGAAVEAWCYHWCICMNGETPTKILPITVDLGDLGSRGRTTAFFPRGGGVNFRIMRTPGLAIESVTFSATNSDGHEARQACLAGSEEQCAVDDSIAAVQLRRKRLWKKQQQHYRPRRPLTLQAPPIYNPPTDVEATIQESVCGGTCEKPSDCTTAAAAALKNDEDDNDYDCRCQLIQTTQQAHTAGKGPFYPLYQSLCLPALASFQAVGVGGRGLGA